MNAPAGKDSGESAAPEPLRVLLVEDSNDDVLLLLRELRRGGYAPVHERVETPEALQRALAERGPWDVVLSDYRMPRFRSSEALAMCEKAGAGVPFIVVSGQAGEEAAVEALRTGARDYVVKDNLGRLCPAVRRSLEEAKVRREQARTETELMESRERFELAVRGAHDGLWDWNLETGEVYLSPRWKSILGYEDHEVANSFEEWETRIHPDDRQRALAAVWDHLDGLSPHYELEHRLLHRDGTYRWVRTRGTSVRNDSGRPTRLAGAHWDVTERKKTEEDLKRRDGILEAVRLSAEHFLKSISWEDDIEGVLGRLGTAARVGRVYVFENYVGQDGNLWATQRYEWTAPGVSPQIGNPLMQALPYRAQGWGRWQEVLSRGETLYGHTREFPEEERPELEAQHIKSIVLVPAFVDGAWWGFIGFDECDRERRWSAAEIGALQHSASTLGAAIQRERTEAALKEREEQYRRIFEESSDGLVIQDMQGNIVEANRALCEMHGYTREEFLALPPLANIHPDYRHLMPEYIRMVEEGGEYRIRSVDLRKDGTTFHVEVHGTRFTYMGKPHVLGEVRDITERVEAYRLLEERVEERTRELATLLEVSGEVASTLELRRLLGLILQRVKGVIDYDAAAISLLDDQDQLNLFLYEGPIPDSDLRSVPPFAQARGREDKVDGEDLAFGLEVVRYGKPVIVQDVLADTNEARTYRDRVTALLDYVPDYIGTWMGVPLTVRDRAIGMLSFDHSKPQYYTRRHADLALAFANQAAIAIENARLFEQAQSAAILEERQRLARELHDSVSQALYSIILGADAARSLLERDPGRVAEPLDYLSSLAEAGLAEMRALIFELRPESLEPEGLVVALEKRAEALKARHEIEVKTDLSGEPRVSQGAKDALYRVAQEALHNIVKHSQATTVALRLGQDAGFVSLTVQDDGVGFDPAGDFPGHLGLKSMRERAERLGGTLELESSPGKGTRVRMRIPDGA